MATVLLVGSTWTSARATGCDDESVPQDVWVDASGSALVGADTGLNDGKVRACVSAAGEDVEVTWNQGGMAVFGCEITLVVPGAGATVCDAGSLPTDGLAQVVAAGRDNGGTTFVLEGLGAASVTANYNIPCTAGVAPLLGNVSGTITITGVAAIRNGVTTATVSVPYSVTNFATEFVVLTGPSTVTFANGAPPATSAFIGGAGAGQAIPASGVGGGCAPQPVTAHLVSVVTLG